VLASTHDIDTLVAGGFVAPAWRDQPERGIACRSIVVIAVRKGNPKDIHDWADLARPGLRLITPEPTTSGGGRWNVVALYGAALRGHAGVPAGDAKAALDFVRRVLANSGARKANANDSFRAFRDGEGDVAIAYESEILLGWIFGRDEERVIPQSTVLIENPAVLIAKNADRHGVRPAAEGLLRFLWTSEAQKEIAFCGLRPVDAAVASASKGQFPVPADLWTIDDLGGWDRARREILVPAGFAAPTVPK
jgi:sulfate transport system substrate-binding protein